MNVKKRRTIDLRGEILTPGKINAFDMCSRNRIKDWKMSLQEATRVPIKTKQKNISLEGKGKKY